MRLLTFLLLVPCVAEINFVLYSIKEKLCWQETNLLKIRDLLSLSETLCNKNC